MLRSALPFASASRLFPVSSSTYSISEKPSSRSKSSARYWGAKQIAGPCMSRTFFVSGGGSAAARYERPSSEAALKADVPPRNLRRLVPSPFSPCKVPMVLPPSVVLVNRQMDYLISLSVTILDPINLLRQRVAAAQHCYWATLPRYGQSVFQLATPVV